VYGSEPEFKLLAKKLAVLIKDSGEMPEVLIGLSYGGYVTAVYLGKLLGLRSDRVIGLPAGKNDDGTYYVGDLVTLGDLAGALAFVVDDSCNRGELLELAAGRVRDAGGEPRTCVVIASTLLRPPGREPDFVVETRQIVPDFFWDDLD
jgi:hypoxanthine phosphoribosyltransferase